MTIFPLQAAASDPQLGMVLGVLVGFGFGFVLERAGFGNARKLAGQFYGNEMVMLKVMFTAIVTAVLGTVVLSGLGLLDLRGLADSVTSGTFIWPMIAGGFLIGVGIIFSGYCPGTSLVGIASGKLDAVLAYGGVMLGQLLWTELEFRPAFAKFHDSGDLGHVYLQDLFRIPAPVVAAAIVAMALGAFLLGEKIERLVTKAPPAPATPQRRLVFAGMIGLGAFALATLAVRPAAAATAERPATLDAPDLARRVVDAPWKVRVLDLRPMEACAKARVPGAECAPAADLAKLGLRDDASGRDVVLVADSDLADVPADARGYHGKVFALRGGFEAWKTYALADPVPPAAGAPADALDAYRVRAGIHAALTGAAAPPPPPAPAASSGAPRHKAGGGCSG